MINIVDEKNESEVPAGGGGETDISASFNSILRKAGVKDLVRLVAFPVFEKDEDQKAILIRLENLDEMSTYEVDIGSITDYLLILARKGQANSNDTQGMLNLNFTTSINNIVVTEMTHAGSQKQEMANHSVDADGNIN